MAHTRQFSADEMFQQIFSFKPPIIKYIFDKINYKHLHKLYQCCKFFPNKFPLIIIHQICDISYTSQYLYYNNKPVAQENVSKIWFTDRLDIRTNNIKLAEWISKIMICDIKIITIDHQNLSFEMFKCLVQSGNVEYLTMGTVMDVNGKSLPLDEIVSYVPFADVIRLSGALISPNTFTNLAAMKRKNKITAFEINNIDEIINSDELIKFMEMHACKDDSYFGIFFSPKVSANYVHRFRNKIKQKIQYVCKNWKQKPGFQTDIVLMEKFREKKSLTS